MTDFLYTWAGPGVICPKHGTHPHTIASNIKGHEGHWCMICALEALGDPLPTISEEEYLNASMTDFRALCAELVEALNTNDYYDERSDKMAYSGLLSRARAALTQPEPQEPTDGDLIELFNENDWNYISPETFLDIARSVLELR